MLLQHRRAFASLIYGFDMVVLYLGAVVGHCAAGQPLPGVWHLLAELMLTGVVWTWLAVQLDLYASRRTTTWIPELKHLLVTAFLTLSSLVLVRVVLGGAAQLEPTRALIVAIGAMVGLRIALRSALLMLRSRGHNTRNVLFVGRGSTARRIADDYRQHPHYGIVILGELNFTGEDHLRAAAGVRPLGPVANLERVLREHAVDEVLICPSDGVWTTEVKSVLKFLQTAGLNCRVAPDFLGIPLERTSVTATGDVPTYTVHTGFGDRHRLGVKRVLDLVGASVGLTLLSPVLLAIAVAIKLSSKGPVFFKQTRLGLHARPFTLIKFRSMVVNAEELKARLAAQNEQAGPVFKMKHDPRITAVGRFIRKYSLDELPQLINIVRGDMSIVGPRPPLPSEVDQYDWWQRRRLSVRPGLTCIWQVSGRNAISFDRWMELDMQYIDGWSLAMDLKIMAKTVREVFRGGGA